MMLEDILMIAENKRDSQKLVNELNIVFKKWQLMIYVSGTKVI